MTTQGEHEAYKKASQLGTENTELRQILWDLSWKSVNEESVDDALIEKALELVNLWSRKQRIDELQRISNARGLHAKTFDYVTARVKELERLDNK